MSELSIVINCCFFNTDELKSYLLSLNGITSVEVIDIDELLRLHIKYDNNLITCNIIKLEIQAFINELNYSVIFEFDKYSKEKLNTYEILLDYVCCEYCYASSIEEMFDTVGIEKVTSNFYQKHFKREYKEDKYKIIVNYNPKLVTLDKIKEIEKDI